MNIEWLEKKMTVEEAEEKNMIVDRRLGPSPVPFGPMSARWREFKAKMEEGDELWTFRSPPRTWGNMMGRAGFCIVRGGEIVDSLVVTMN